MIFMRFVRLTLILGGLFNLSMGVIFSSNKLLQYFFRSSEGLEKMLFHREISLAFPTDPVHQLLIHGFGAGVVILGATLLYSAKDPQRLLPFIFLDGLGRLLYGVTMIKYIFEFSLPRTMLLFGFIELGFAFTYIWISRYLRRTS